MTDSDSLVITVSEVSVQPVIIDFWQVTPTIINEGDSATISWQVQNADNCSIAPSIGDVNSISGSLPVQPDETTTYTLTCSGEGEGASDDITLTVTSASQIKAAELYAGQCASCHGANGEGSGGENPTFPPLGDLGQKYTLEEVTTIIAERMPSADGPDCDGLENCEEAIAEYILSTFTSTGNGQALFECSSPEEQSVSSIRRLSKEEYGNTLRSLLAMGLSTVVTESIMNELDSAMKTIPADHNEMGFQGLDQRLSQQHVDAYLNVAIVIADEVASSNSRLRSFLGNNCASTSSMSSSCAQSILQASGHQFLRRPVTGDDVTFYADSSDYQSLIVRLLMSPDFLTHAELDGSESNSGIVALDDYEIASRLSYHFWGTMPDEALFSDAQNGVTTSNYSAVLNRVFDDARTREWLNGFYAQWLKLEEIPEINAGDVAGFDKFLEINYAAAGGSTSLSTNIDLEAYREDAINEISHLGDYYTWQTLGQLEDLFTSDISFATTNNLATAYGVQAWSEGDYADSALRHFPAGQRSGLLTRAALHIYGKHNPRPVMKGVRIRNDLLCDALPLPENNSTPEGVVIDDDFTTRERIVAITETPGTACVQCHITGINPLGFATEDFDALGRFRGFELVLGEDGEEVARPPIDAHASVSITNTDVSEVNNGVQLGAVIAPHDKLKACFARQYFRYTFAKIEEDNKDDCAIQSLYQQLNANSSLRDVLKAAANSAQFRQRKLETE